MSILIKGMKMPEKCGSCDLFHVESPMHCTVVKGHKTVGAPYGVPRPDWCPLVEIPVHGRLIDADEMCADLVTVDPQYETMIEWCIQVTNAQPTVIEGSENHDD